MKIYLNDLKEILSSLLDHAANFLFDDATNEKSSCFACCLGINPLPPQYFHKIIYDSQIPVSCQQESEVYSS